MKKIKIHYDAVIYLLVLFLGFAVSGYLLAVYHVNQLILFANLVMTLRLVQTGSAAIAIAIAWISIWFWGGVMLWATPISFGKMSPRAVALWLLLCWMLSIAMIFLLAFASKYMNKLGLKQHYATYGLLAIVWGGMAIGWLLY
jgi:hypothetical protein